MESNLTSHLVMPVGPVVTAFYAATGWLLVQIATQVLPLFDVPTWTMRVVNSFELRSGGRNLKRKSLIVSRG